MGFKTEIQKIARKSFRWNISPTDPAWAQVRLLVSQTSASAVVEQFRQWAADQATMPVNLLGEFARQVLVCPEA
jgi:hypothetical protein